MINFLSADMKPNVKSDAILDDFYLPDNLISSDLRKSNLGFMAYHVVKPPIYLDFELVCNTDIHCIKIWPKVDSLKTIGFEIFVKSDSSTDYEKVGSCYNLIEDGLIFVRSDSVNASVAQENNFKVLHFYRASHYKLLRHVKWVRIRLVQTARCAPVLRKAEIWGHISRREPEDIRDGVQKLHRKVKQKIVTPTDDNEERLSDRTEGSSSSGGSNDTFSIPEEFLDTITYEIMSLPMVLPSGKTIDRLTLEKHNLQEEKWGRLPSDPYTGQCFTTERKPILNTALKAQIDKFLLENEHTAEYKMTARTVGTVKNATKRTLSNECNYYSATATSQSQHNLPKRQRTAECTSLLVANPAAQSACLQASGTLRIVSTPTSLNDAVKNALKNVTRFTRRVIATEKVECYQCNNGDTDCLLYKIGNCSHFICRQCLSYKNLKLCRCGCSFGNKDVEKFHRSIL